MNDWHKNNHHVLPSRSFFVVEKHETQLIRAHSKSVQCSKK